MGKILLFCLFACNVIGSTFADEPYYVGELGSAWDFPSDHLPIGASFHDFNIVFWNVLNKNYLGHIEENSQGLKDSSILQKNIPVNTESDLTVRELEVGQMILEMIHQPSALIGLEEVHPDLLAYLKKNIPPSFKIVSPPGQPNSQDIYLYDQTVFEEVSVEAVKYSPVFPKTIFTLTLKEKTTGHTFRFIQSHVPGGPINSAPSVALFAKEAMRQFNPDFVVVLMGDMNQLPKVIEEALQKAAKPDEKQPYSHLSIDYPTHVNTRSEASWIDNFFLYVPEGYGEVNAISDPQKIAQDLSPVVNLLNSIKN